MSRTKYRHVLTTTVLVCIFIISVVLNTSPAQRNNNVRATEEDCTTELAGDLYGLGVRMGVYFQWLSGWISNTFLLEEIGGALDGNAIFLTALIVSVINSTIMDNLTQMDGIIMLWLCAGTIWSVLSLWGYRTCCYKEEGLNGMRRFGGFGTHLRLLLASSVGWYALWFWLRGVKGPPHGLPVFGEIQTCTRTQVTLFGASLTGIASNAALVLSGITLIYSAAVVLVAPIALVTRIRKAIIFWRAKQWSSSTRLRYTPGLSQKELILVFRILSVLCMVWLLSTAVAIEITLNQNFARAVLGGPKSTQSRDILKPGQLIPLLMGAFSFIRLLFVAFETWRAPSGDTTPSLGRSASRRYSKVGPKSTRSRNPLKLFSEANADQGGLYESSAEPSEAWKDGIEDDYYALHRRLKLWQRLLVTFAPHLSLLWYWPWTKHPGHQALASEDDATAQLQPSPMAGEAGSQAKVGFALSELETGPDEDTSYRRKSQTSLPERYEPQRVRDMY